MTDIDFTSWNIPSEDHNNIPPLWIDVVKPSFTTKGGYIVINRIDARKNDYEGDAIYIYCEDKKKKPVHLYLIGDDMEHIDFVLDTLKGIYKSVEHYVTK